MQTDPQLSTLSGSTGGATHANSFLGYSLGTGGSMTLDAASNPKTLTTAERGGTSQGIRILLPGFVTRLRPGYSYEIEFSGEFLTIGGNFPRFRLEAGPGNNPANQVILAGTSADMDGLAFSLSTTITQAQLNTWRTAGNPSISLGNTSGENINIRYTGLKITRRAP
jgi:hypothetical protein